jgi:hypothetical protein
MERKPKTEQHTIWSTAGNKGTAGFMCNVREETGTSHRDIIFRVWNNR